MIRLISLVIILFPIQHFFGFQKALLVILMWILDAVFDIRDKAK